MNKFLKKNKLLKLSVLSGLLLACAWPTYGFAPLIFVAFIPLLSVEKSLSSSCRKGSWQLFGYAFLTFLMFNVITTWWISNSALIAGVLACLLNSFLMAITFQLYHIVRMKAMPDNVNGNLALIPFWIGFEKLHYTWEINWPWLNLGNVFASNPALIQWYSITGVLGGTFWILLVNILLFNVIDAYALNKDRKLICRKFLLPLLIVVLPIVCSVITYFKYEEVEDPVEVVVYQPNSDPYTVQFNLTDSQIVDRFEKNVKPLVDENTDFIICPESMMQNSCFESRLDNMMYVKSFRQFLKDNAPNAAIIVGASTLKLYEKGEDYPFSARQYADGARYDAFNTSVFIDTTETLQLHHKSKLTPGVEIMPYIRYMPFIEELALDLGGTSGTLGIDKEMMPFWSMNSHAVPAPVICYESVFGEHVTEFIRNYANVIFISTNDGWWNETQGHKQHCEYASILAIETRRSIARSANTGISCVVNQRGDIMHRTKYWEQDAFKCSINMNSELTFYAKNGDWIADIATVLVILLIAIAITNLFVRKRY